MQKKRWECVQKVWKDPVWSKVIAVGIVALIAFIWGKYNPKVGNELFDHLITFRIPAYLTILGVLLLLILQFFYRRSKHRKKDPLYLEMVGNYTFEDLCKILQREKIEGRTMLMELNHLDPIEENLLDQFIVFAPMLNQGINLNYPNDDGGYLYGLFCPSLMSYDLIDKIEYKDERTNLSMVQYQTSTTGKKFLSLWNKHVLKVDSQNK